MLEHNFNNHYESWHETVLNRFTVIKQKLFDKQEWKCYQINVYARQRTTQMVIKANIVIFVQEQ